LLASAAEAQHERELVALQVSVSVRCGHCTDACAAPRAGYVRGSQHTTELLLRPRTLLSATGLTSRHHHLTASCARPLLAQLALRHRPRLGPVRWSSSVGCMADLRVTIVIVEGTCT
jgi:hypothetical protein